MKFKGNLSNQYRNVIYFQQNHFYNTQTPIIWKGKIILDGTYLFIVYTKPFCYYCFGIIWPSNELWHTVWRGKKWSHAHTRIPIFTLDINGGHIEILPTLTANSSSKTFLKQYIFPKLQIDHQVNVSNPFQYFLRTWTIKSNLRAYHKGTRLLQRYYNTILTTLSRERGNSRNNAWLADSG